MRQVMGEAGRGVSQACRPFSHISAFVVPASLLDRAVVLIRVKAAAAEKNLGPRLHAAQVLGAR